jgi:hypothetical protein
LRISRPSSEGSPSSAAATISSKRPGSTSITSPLCTAALVRRRLRFAGRRATTVTESLAVTLSFAPVGMIVAWRQPRNPIGWFMLCFALGFMLSTDAGLYDIADYRFGRGLPLGPASLLLYLLWEPALLLGPLAVLLFPVWISQRS